jgi:FkbM family methyltransferase
VPGWLAKSVSKTIRAAGDIGGIAGASGVPYTIKERVSLVRARMSRQNETGLLNYRVNYLNRASFRIVLREVFFQGEYFFESETDAPVILDCGANIGLATLFFKHIYPDARISAFEADPVTASVLKKNVEQNNLEDVSVNNVMLSNAEGLQPFYIPDGEVGSLRGTGDPRWFPNHLNVAVEAARLSKYIAGPVDMLKLDVEGSEFNVLTDLKDSGKIAQIRRMVIEYHHRVGAQVSCLARTLALLEDAGFEYQISASRSGPIARQGAYQDILIGAHRTDR